MIDEKRRVMMNLRSCNPEMKAYDVLNDQFDSAFIGKTLKKKQLEKIKKKEEKYLQKETNRRQRILAQ